MFTAIKAREWGPDYGYGKRKIVTGAYTVNQNGRRVRAFLDQDGGIEAAQKWANYLNEHLAQVGGAGRVGI